MVLLLALIALTPLLEGASGTISLFLPSAEKASDYQEQYLQQPPAEYPASQQYGLQGQYNPHYGQPLQLHDPQPSPVYWTGEQPSANEDYQAEEDPSGYRYQSYQSTYRQQVQQSLPYPATYPPVYQPVIPHHSHLPSYQQLSDPVIVPAGGVPHRLAAPTSLPVYQLVTVGPEVPVLVRLPNQQTAILPVRTVYSLPSFLERIVQRVQNYYSVYNPLEVLKLPVNRQNETDSSAAPTYSSSEAPTETTTPGESGGLSDRNSQGSTTAKVSTLKVFEVPTTTDPPAATTEREAETTTTDSADNEVQETTTTAN